MANATDTHELNRRVAVLRQATLELLGDCTAGRGGARRADLIVALQDASNRLGAAQAALDPPVAVPPTPAAIASSDPAPRADAERPGTVPDGPLSAEAAIVLALAEVTIPFAGSREDAAERWLRILRLEGQAGAALQALGMDEFQLATRAELASPAARMRSDAAVGGVREQATRLTRGRGGKRTTTLDVLFAVLIAYGRLFDRALYAVGTSRDELLERVAGRAEVTRGR
jgi:hypothetical protein